MTENRIRIRIEIELYSAFCLNQIRAFCTHCYVKKYRAHWLAEISVFDPFSNFDPILKL